MAVGKTSVGKRLAERLGFQLIDTDLYLERKYRRSIADMINLDGEAVFRKRERYVIEEVAPMENCIISTGGGASCSQYAIDILTSCGMVIYLTLSQDDLSKRVFTYRRKRPAVANLTQEEVNRFVEEKMSERAPFYTQAHHQVDVTHIDTQEEIDAVCEEIETLYGEYLTESHPFYPRLKTQALV